MNQEYAHFDDFPRSQWRWPDFTPRELRSKSDNRLMVDPHSMDCLQDLRAQIAKPMILTSAYRSAAHNKKVGGAKNSQHKLARAFDVKMGGHNPAMFEAAARACGFTGFGFYPKSRPRFMHIDTRPIAAEWGERWWTGTAAPPPKTPKAAPRAVSGGLLAALITLILRLLGKGTSK
jgi:zinc D-Ala-D-Ala carboxypeptidase